MTPFEANFFSVSNSVPKCSTLIYPIIVSYTIIVPSKFYFVSIDTIKIIFLLLLIQQIPWLLYFSITPTQRTINVVIIYKLQGEANQKGVRKLMHLIVTPSHLDSCLKREPTRDERLGGSILGLHVFNTLKTRNLFIRSQKLHSKRILESYQQDWFNNIDSTKVFFT